jgi:hypothetical protein
LKRDWKPADMQRAAARRGSKPRALIEGGKHTSPDVLSEWATAAEHILVF